MKQRLLIAGWTIVILGAGYVAGVWTERHSCKVPPPPPLLGELSDKKAAAAVKPNTPAPPSNAARLAGEIAKLGPQIEAFRQRMEQIDREMDQEIVQILRPDQAKAFQSLVDKGVAKDVVWDRTTAKKGGRESTGHGLPPPNTMGPQNWSLRLPWTLPAMEADAILGARIKLLRKLNGDHGRIG